MSQIRQLETRLPPDVQVFFLSPLVDDSAAAIARRLQVATNAVTVVSPDVGGPETTGTRFARLHRTRRIQELHRADVRLVDWDVDKPLGTALERTAEVWR